MEAFAIIQAWTREAVHVIRHGLYLYVHTRFEVLKKKMDDMDSGFLI